MFKQCSNCHKVWRTYQEFLADPSVTLVGYQVSFKDLESGLFIFNHSCKTTMGIPANLFTHLYDGPIFKERLTGTDKCPEHCLHKYDLEPCPYECECAYVRAVLQVVKNWPKERERRF